jgi:hypothetical protein
VQDDVALVIRRVVVNQFNCSARQVAGIWPSYRDFRSLILFGGRLVTEEDEQEMRRVTILDWNAAKQLVPGQNAILYAAVLGEVPGNES